jgi:hypothetical protein
MNRFQPATVPVQVINIPGDYSGAFVTPGAITIEPNPVFAELRSAGPRPPRPSPRRRRPAESFTSEISAL